MVDRQRAISSAIGSARAAAGAVSVPRSRRGQGGSSSRAPVGRPEGRYRPRSARAPGSLQPVWTGGLIRADRSALSRRTPRHRRPGARARDNRRLPGRVRPHGVVSVALTIAHRLRGGKVEIGSRNGTREIVTEARWRGSGAKGPQARRNRHRAIDAQRRGPLRPI